MDILNNISIILVDTKTPANIGAVARCMMNMGLSRLVLVDPPKDDDREALKLAAGAQVILDNAVTAPSLADAVSGHGLVIGTSRHPGKQRKNILEPRALAEQVMPLLEKSRVAIVFGNEVNGLEMRDIALCQEIVAIPSSHAFPSLNLSHAVMVVSYELFLASRTEVISTEKELAPMEEVEGFYRHLQGTLEEVGFLERGHPERMMFSLRQLFGRARLDAREIKILRGILSSVARSIRRHEKEI